ncbi:four helix bundle protein [Flectobacillus sp. DC10W]|uniref:Four helix bundle protein n=1 Tax=Flectobacillus longus TaxID=2984207 RepID=A0ABT6YTY9_9BACT|nr:four helix bundle protein [Flectobacillus longus]MDI9867067.1 four helix bundle protein [Flectobacillus longus]
MDKHYLPKEEFAEMIFVRIKAFSLRCMPLCDNLFLKTISAKNIAKQLARSSTSSVANYRAVRRARSRNEFYAKLSIVIEELDESIFWLEYSLDANFYEESKVKSLIIEGYEILKILAKARKTASENKSN